MKVGIAGDWHGNTKWAVSVLDAFAEAGVWEVYQLGDFGIWPGESGKKFVDDVCEALERNGQTLWVVPGNHEDYTQIEDPETLDGSVPPIQVFREGEGWQLALLPRGTVWEREGVRFLALGGAPSIDYPDRVEGRNWWRAEMIRDSDLLRLRGLGKIDVMLTHDAPDDGTQAVQDIIDGKNEFGFGWSNAGLKYAARGRWKMNKAVEMVQPKMFVHGHMHVADVSQDEKTGRTYVALAADGNEGNVMMIDLEAFKDGKVGEIE